nr:MAG TPA: hypothetical protein [Caudoviricetes sp.]
MCECTQISYEKCDDVDFDANTLINMYMKV